MINFEDFEVSANLPAHTAAPSLEQHCEPVSAEHFLTPQQTTHSLHDTNIEEIDDHYSSFEHSANILDRIDRCEDLFPHEESVVGGGEDSEECKLRRRM
jgi:hypothetical protein